MAEFKNLEFFHQATMKICGDLDINKVLRNCFIYLKQFIPLSGIYLNIFDRDQNLIQNIAMVSNLKSHGNRFSISLPEEGRKMIEKAKLEEVQFINKPDQNPRKYCNYSVQVHENQEILALRWSLRRLRQSLL